MNKSQEALNFLGEYSLGCAVTNHKDDTIKVINKYKQTLQELVDKHEQLEQENFDLRQKLNTEEECCAMLEKKVKKLKNIIQILNRIYGFKLQYIPYNGYPELLIPDMTSDELTKEEYELLQEEIEER